MFLEKMEYYNVAGNRCGIGAMTIYYVRHNVKAGNARV